MAAIGSTPMLGKGARQLVTSTLGASDTFTYQNGAMLTLFNGSGSSISPVVKGSGATALNIRGMGGPTDLTGGYQFPVIANGETASVRLDTISKYLKGEITITGGGGSEIAVYNYLDAIPVQTVTPPANSAPTIDNAFTALSITKSGSGTIDLNNIFDDIEDADSALTYTFSGDVNINVAIASGVATITNKVSSWSGAESVTFRATDTGGLFVEQSINITVTSTSNTAPSATAKSRNALVDTVVNITATELLVGATDAEGNAITVKELTYSGVNGSLVDNGNDTWDFTPTSGFSGGVVLSYVLTDTVADSSATNLTITFGSIITGDYVWSSTYRWNK